MCLHAFRSGGVVLEHPTGRTRSAFNARPAPVPPAFAGVTRVGHEFCPWPCGPSVGATSHQTRKEIIMARSNTAPAQETNPPEFLAWHVANKGDKGFWTRIGAAWFHRDRKGLSLQLEVVPTLISRPLSSRCAISESTDACPLFCSRNIRKHADGAQLNGHNWILSIYGRTIGIGRKAATISNCSQRLAPRCRSSSR